MYKMIKIRCALFKFCLTSKYTTYKNKKEITEVISYIYYSSSFFFLRATIPIPATRITTAPPKRYTP